MNFYGRAEKLADIDLPRIGAIIGVGEDEIHAVIDVEARGGGFDKSGRPKMLFEPHIFYRQLGPGPLQDIAVKKGLAYRRWGAVPYPRDSYPRLFQASEIDQGAAMRSASWGMGQIMGFNHAAAGYDTAFDMVADFVHTEESQLRAMVRFIETNGLDDELRAHDWRGFARGYNGPGYAKHGYHTKLAKSYLKWSKIKDTPFMLDRLEPKQADPAEQQTGLAAFLAAIMAFFGKVK